MSTASSIWGYRASLALCLLVAFAGPAQAADWPTYRGNPARSGVSQEAVELPLETIWVHTASHPPRPAWPPPAENDYFHRLHGLSPTMIFDRAFHVVAVDGALYYGSSADDTVYCLSVATGGMRWSFTTEGPVRLAPTVAGGKLYVGSDDGFVYCLDASDGRLLWKYRVGPEDHRQPGNGRVVSLWPVRSGVVVREGTAYFAAGLFPTKGVFLCALGANDGEEIWKHEINISAQGYLLASPSRLFMPTGRTAPHAFDRSNGQALGSLGRLGGSFALVLEDMIAHGGSEDSRISINEPITREQIVSTPAIRLLADGPMVYFLRDGTLAALDRNRYLDLSREIRPLEAIRSNDRTEAQQNRLAELKRQRLACQKWTAPCDAPYEMIMTGDVIFTGGNNEVIACSAADGSVLWEGVVEGKAYGLAISDGRLFVSTDAGVIHCFGRGSSQANAIGPSAMPDNPPLSTHPADELTRHYEQTAETVLKESGVTQGYCLVLGAGTGRLAREIAKRSELRIIGVEEDAEKVRAARALLRQTGLYGDRIVIHQTGPARLPYQSGFANLIVSDASLAGGRPPSTPAAEVQRLLRPCGGVAAIACRDADALNDWGRDRLPGWTVMRKDGSALAMARRGPLAGAGQWTHTYAEPGNTACSGDQLTHGPMDLQWFGRPGPRQMIDRHHRNVPPLYRDGRCFIPGDRIVFAVDAYNGTILWTVQVPNSRRLGVFLDSSNLAVDEQCLYLAAEDKCRAFDVVGGEQRFVHEMPQAVPDDPHYWGYLAVVDDLTFGSGCKKNAAYVETSYDADVALWHRGMKLIASDFLFALDRTSGEVRWVHRSGLIINTTITIGGGRMYFVETSSPRAAENTLGRMPLQELFDGGEQHLVALDMRTGDVLYRQPLDVTRLEETCYLNYADETLLLSGSRAAEGTVGYDYYAFGAAFGTPQWQADHLTGLPDDGGHGEYNRHPTIVGNTVYAWPYAYDLKTGRRDDDWKFDRLGHGCGGVSASAHSLFWRGGNPWMYDLNPGGGPLRLTGISRPGCWINIIPAGGLVLIPESSSGCTCPFSIQTSLAFRPALPTPTFSPALTMFVDAVELELADPLGTGRIRYTLDGSDPAVDSPRYSEPIRITRRTRVRARIHWDDGTRSQVIERTYTKVKARAAETVSNPAPMVRYTYYEGSGLSSIGNLSGLQAVDEGYVDRFGLAPARRADGIGLIFQGLINVPRDGIYTFFTTSDDGSCLQIGDQMVVDNDGLHGKAERSGQIALRAGVHPITVSFFEAGGSDFLLVAWEGPGLAKQEIPASVLYHRP